MATVEVTFTPLAAHVRTARLVATAVARRSGVAESLLDEVRLAVGEACSRAVEAHQLHCPTEPVRISLTDQAGRFEIEVINTSPALGPPESANAGPESRPRPGTDPVKSAGGADDRRFGPAGILAGRDRRPGRRCPDQRDRRRHQRPDELAVRWLACQRIAGLISADGREPGQLPADHEPIAAT